MLIYIDNILVFNRTIKEYLNYLNKALTLLKSSDITLQLAKCYFAFSSIQILEHYMLRLGLNIVLKKIDVI